MPDQEGLVQTILSKVRSNLDSPELRDHLKPGAFSRSSGTIKAPDMIVNDLLNYSTSGNTSARNLRDDFKVRSPKPKRGKGKNKGAVTASAITQARAKFLPSLWIWINAIILAGFGATGLRLKTFNGYTVRAADGTWLWANNLIINSFVDGLNDAEFARLEKDHPKVYESTKKLLMVLLYDPINQLQIGHVVSLEHKGERELLVGLLDLLKNGDLLVLDRGYPAAFLFWMLQLRGIKFLTRIKADHCKAVREFAESDDLDRVVELPISPSGLSQLKAFGVAPPASGCIKVRLLKHFKDGNLRILASSLTQAEASRSELGNLYSGRWEIEKNICTLKLPLNLEGWRSYSQEGVEYDIGCRSLAHNLMILMSWRAAQELKKKGPSPSGRISKINKTFSLGELKPTLLPIFRDQLSPKEIRQLLRQYHEELVRKPSVIAPNRVCPIANGRAKTDRRTRANRKPAN